MANKKTKKDLFNEVLAIAEVQANEELVNFINHELELLSKKASKSGSTKTQKENENIMETILQALEEIGRAVTITELQKENEEMAQYSNQKLSALIKKLLDAGKVAKIVDKKKSLFKIAE